MSMWRQTNLLYGNIFTWRITGLHFVCNYFICEEASYGGTQIFILHQPFSLLCAACPSANTFSAILFLLFARSSSNSPRSFQRFGQTLRRIFNWIWQQMKNFPIDPHCKNCPLSDLNEILHQSWSKTFQ